MKTSYAKQLTGLSLGLFFAGVGMAANPITLDAGHSSINFISTQMGVPVPGKFQRFTVNAVFDPQALAQAKLNVQIDMNSVTLDSAEVDETVKQADWFDTQHYPQASFSSTSIKRVDAQNFLVSGTLHIKGQSQAVTVPLHLTPAADHGGTLATGKIVIRRDLFHIGAGQWADPSLVADLVTVNFSLSLHGLTP